MVQPQGHTHIHAVTHFRRGPLLSATSADARLSSLAQAALAISVVGVGGVGVVGRVQEVALVLLGGSWLVKEQLGVGWVLPPASTLTAGPYSDLLLRRSLVQEEGGATQGGGKGGSSANGAFLSARSSHAGTDNRSSQPSELGKGLHFHLFVNIYPERAAGAGGGISTSRILTAFLLQVLNTTFVTTVQSVNRNI